MQLAQAAVRLAPIEVVDAIGHVGRLLRLQDHRAIHDGVHGARPDVKEVSRLDGHEILELVPAALLDHLGKLGHTVYPGADDNASGVAALLSLARMFSAMKADGKGPRKNLIFVAFDGKELDMFGSRRFVRNLDIPHSKITAMVNMDMLGTDLVPPRRNREYLFAIGENSLPESYRGYLSYICTRARYKMDLDLTFYGSRNFWKMMYETSDQHPFARAGIPAVLFTSAFHQHTLKKTDTPAIIDYQLLRKRTLVIYNFILRLCAEN